MNDVSLSCFSDGLLHGSCPPVGKLATWFQRSLRSLFWRCYVSSVCRVFFGVPEVTVRNLSVPLELFFVEFSLLVAHFLSGLSATCHNQRWVKTDVLGQ